MANWKTRVAYTQYALKVVAQEFVNEYNYYPNLVYEKDILKQLLKIEKNTPT